MEFIHVLQQSLGRSIAFPNLKDSLHECLGLFSVPLDVMSVSLLPQIHELQSDEFPHALEAMTLLQDPKSMHAFQQVALQSLPLFVVMLLRTHFSLVQLVGLSQLRGV